MQDKYDFDFIFVTTNEAVRHANRIMTENQNVNVIVGLDEISDENKDT